MRFVIFTHSLASDWNHGNAHFLRGFVTELQFRGHEVSVWEPEVSWSRQNLLEDQGQAALDEFAERFPNLQSERYNENQLDLDFALRGADVVLVHEWNSTELIARINQYRASHSYALFFHDTHHRSVTEPAAMARYDLSHFDGVLAYGRVIRELYRSNGWAKRAWTWHEAADTRVFRPQYESQKDGDLVWIGNWGDNERSESLLEFLMEPVKKLGLRARVYGVRYPKYALEELHNAGIEYGGWLPNYKVPEVFARHRVTIHVPRGPYVEKLPGIPTIRPFEALACGIPMVSAPWVDSEQLFTPDEDFLLARDGREMQSHLERLLSDRHLASRLGTHGLSTIRNRHTCSHRVDELLSILNGVAEPSLAHTATVA